MPDGASRAAIVAVDDPGVSRAVARDLRRRYGELHRIVRAESGEAALDALRQMKLRGDLVAVMLADYRYLPALVPGCFASGLPAREAAVIAATQRPLAASTLSEPSGTPAWKTIPSWAVIGTADKVIPPALLQFMAPARQGAHHRRQHWTPVPDLPARRRHPRHHQRRPRHQLS